MIARARAKRAALAAAVATFALAVPELCYACPVCFDPRESNRWAFIAMTVFMSLLPLSMFGAAVLWIRHRVKAAANLGSDAG